MNEPVIIHKAAELRLGQFWDYTVEKWGEEQADSYLRKLGVCIQGLVETYLIPRPEAIIRHEST